MFFQQRFDPANLSDLHHKHLPSQDIFITLKLDARHLHGSAAIDKLACYQQGQRGQQKLKWVLGIIRTDPLALHFHE